MIDITLQDLEKKLGTYKKRGQHYYFQCCYCADKHKDNMIYTPSKGLLKCFANDEHSKLLLSEIMKEKNKDMKHENKIPQYQIYREDYISYQMSCSAMLLGNYDLVDMSLWEEDISYKFGNHEKIQKYLYKTRGITRETAKIVGLGIDLVDNKWVIPIYNQSGIVGFEYRLADFKNKKIWREIDSPKCLAWIYGKEKCDTLYLCEGFLDSYVLVQFLLENNQKDFAVATPSNGINALLSALSEIKFNNFNKVKLIMDNDNAGDICTKQAIERYPFITDARAFLGDYKDITEYYIEVDK